MIFLFSSIIAFLQNIQKFKLKKQKKETKNEIKKEERKISETEDSIVETKEKAKKSKKVKGSTEKEKKLKIKILILGVLKWIIQIIEQFIMFLISLLGVFGFFIVLVVLILMIAIYGFLHIDFTIPSGDIFSGNTSSEDCIQGGQAISSVGFDLNAMGQLQGTMMEYEKQLFQTLSLYNEILSKNSSDVFPNPSKIEKMKENVSTDVISKFLFGFSATETGLRFNNGTKDVFKYPSKTKANGYGYAFLGLHYGNDFNGQYKYNGVNGRIVLTDSFVLEWKNKYTPSETPLYDNNFVPYGVATQTGSMFTSYIPEWSSVESALNPIMDSYGIQANREKLITFCQMFAGASAYHGGGVNDSLYSLWCALWAATSDVDSERSFDRIEIIYDSKTDYSEGTARKQILPWGSGSGNYFKIGSEIISEPLWKWLQNKYSNNDYFSQTVNSWLQSHNNENSGVVLNGHYGLLAYLMGNRVVNVLGGSVPIVTGGNVEDCDCYEGGNSGILGNLSINGIKNGEINGDWPEDVKANMLKYGWESYFGKSYSLNNLTLKLNKTNVSFEDWRINTKWKVPYQIQYGAIEPWANTVKFGIINWSNACHIYMSSYIASALTGKYINVPEMFAALRATNGVTSNGCYQNGGAYLTFEKLGIHFSCYNYNSKSYQYANLKSKWPEVFPDISTPEIMVNTILDMGGLVGVRTNGGNYTSSGHYFVITEHQGNKYKTASASRPYNDTDWHDLEYITGKNHCNLELFFFAYKENVGTITQTTDFSNYLFIGDSYTKRIEPILTSNGHQVVSAVGATPSQFVGLTTQTKTIGMSGYETTITSLPDNVNGIVVLMGANNTAQVESTKSFLTELLNKYSVPIYVQKVFPVGSGYSTIDANTMNSNIETYNNTIKSFCDANSRLIFIDTTTGYVGSDGFLLHTGDNLHLDISEGQNWYNNISKAIQSNSVSSSSSVNCIDTPITGSFVETPGKFQGNWGDLTSYINQLPEKRKNRMLGLLPYVGTAPINEGSTSYLYNQDKWKSVNGKGAVRYFQAFTGTNIVKEQWCDLSYSETGSSFGSSACGCYCASMIASTLLGKYINPPELGIAAVTYQLRHSEVTDLTSNDKEIISGDTTVFGDYMQKRLLEELGLHCDYSSLTQDKLDNCLNNGGMAVICVNHDKGKGAWLASVSHYVVVREKVNSNYLIYSSTNWEGCSNADRSKAVNYEFSYTDLVEMGSTYANYVTP